MLNDKKNALIAFGSLIVIALVVIIIKLFSNVEVPKDKTTNATLDPTFEMMDPENPLTQVNNIAKQKNSYKQLETELKHNEECAWSLKSKLQQITAISDFPKTFSDDKGITPEGESFLETFSVRNLFDVTDNYIENQSSSLPDQSFKSYLQSKWAWATLLKKKLAEAKVSSFYGASLYQDYYLVSRYDRYSAKEIDVDNKVSIQVQPLQQLPTLAKSEIEKLNNQLSERKTQIIAEMNLLKDSYGQAIEKYSKSRFDMSGKAISYGISAFVLIAIVLYVSGLVFRNKMRKDAIEKNDTNLQSDLRVSMWYSVYMITVLLLIITIFILGLARLIQENTLAALLGGIAGYVLNNKIVDQNASPVRGNTPIPAT